MDIKPDVKKPEKVKEALALPSAGKKPNSDTEEESDTMIWLFCSKFDREECVVSELAGEACELIEFVTSINWGPSM